MKSFTQFGLSDEIQQGLSSLGFTQPTPVQVKVIPLVLEKEKDLVALAQTGTGKTAAFGLPLIEKIDSRKRQTQALILCPTRELCMQVAKDLQSFSKYVKGLNTLAIYGGTSIYEQIKTLRRGVQIIVATPGRLNDLIRREKVDITGVRWVVFDEADEMLQMGFQEELNAILSHTPKEKNTLLFSATMSKEVAAIAGRYMKNPVELTVGKRNAGAENVTHEYYMVHARNRYLALKRIVDNHPGMYSIIFCRTRLETGEVAAKLVQDGYNADALHGELSQGQRDQVMKKFRSKSLQLLVATDVAARGLDVNDLTHVINYNLPDDVAAYTHRSGRTGRAGRGGISIAIIHLKEKYRIAQIEKRLNRKFKLCKVPTGIEICRKQLAAMLDEVTSVEVDHEQIDPLYETVAAQLEHLDREELIKKFISLEFNRFLSYYKNAPDLNVQAEGRKQQKKGDRRKGPGQDSRGQGRFTRFSLNVGRRQGIGPEGLIGKINEIPGVGRIKIGKINIKRNSAHMEAETKFTSQILAAFQHAEINGKTVSIEVVPGKAGGSGGRRRPTRKGKFRSKRRR
ncbi:MAG: ATP-dependent helicase [Desulfobulbus sp.]|nr:MAG: ATP-dependent helicase [Desulfobulbus sp.]